MASFLNHMVWVALGGSLGSVLRFFIVTVSGRLCPAAVFPYGTLLVNVFGCFIIGWIGTLAADKITLSAEMRVFLFTGILGGFTTFSAFGYETFYLFRTSQVHLALLNVLANCFLSLGAVWLGCIIAKI